MDLDKTSEARRRAQRKGEEDPVVVAQRFLNIYRQIHIFNPEKKAAFNKMLLELPPQIRGMFGQLPGGAMLQDYVDELAEKEGVEKSVSSQTTNIAEEDVKQAKILATALAEAQVQASAKMQGMASPSSIAAPMQAPAATVAGTAKLAMDKNFAQEFASVLAAAMQKNSENQESEIKNIINTLGQTQLEIIKVLQEENAEHREEMKNISKMMLQAQANISTAASTTSAQTSPQKISEETKQLIRILLNSQQQILERVTKVEAWAANTNSSQTAVPAAVVGDDFSLMIEKSEQNVSRMIAAFQERQKNDTLEIARLINESQQNLVKMMVQHNNLNQNNTSAANNNANNIQINSADYSSILNRIADQLSNLRNISPSVAPSVETKNTQIHPIENKIEINFPEKLLSDLVSAQSRAYKEVAKQQTKELSSAISLALKEGQKASAQIIINALKDQPIVLKQPDFSMPPQAYIVEQSGNEISHDEPAVLPEDNEKSEISNAASEESNSSSSEVYGYSSYQETIDLNSLEPNVEKSPDGSPQIENLQPINEEAFEDVVATPKKKKKKKKKKKDTLSLANEPEVSISDGAELQPIAEISSEAVPLDPSEIVSNDLHENGEQAQEEAVLQANSEVVSETSSLSEDLLPEESLSGTVPEENDINSWLEKFEEQDGSPIVSESLEDVVVEHFDTPDDWGFTSAPEKKEEPQGDTQDWEWVYEEEQTAPDEDNAGEGIDWEWDYVPEDTAGSTTFHNTQLQPLAENCPIYSGNLFFQEHVLSSQPIVNSQPSPVLTYHPGILDSASADESRDPYKNSSLKD